MTPTMNATLARKLWFNKPWVVEKDNPSFMAHTLATNPVHGEDKDYEVMQKTVAVQSIPTTQCSNLGVAEKELEDKIIDDGIYAQVVLGDET